MYGDDALFVASTFNRTTATVRWLGAGEGGGGTEGALASQTVSPRLLAAMLRRLVTELGYSFEVWAQLGGKGSQWSVVRRGSPGNFEDEAGPADDPAQGAPFMAALQLGAAPAGSLAVGLAFVDQLGLLVGMHEWVEDDSASLSGVEAALLQLGARECLVSSTALQQYPQLRTMLCRADVVMTEKKAADFKGDAEHGDGAGRPLSPLNSWCAQIWAVCCTPRRWRSWAAWTGSCAARPWWRCCASSTCVWRGCVRPRCSADAGPGRC